MKLDDGTRIDAASQKILTRLNSDDWTYTGTLQDAAELSQNGQVLYRLEEHLIPGGLVEEEKRRREMDPRRFKLTRFGGEWLEEHEAEVTRPSSRVETQQMAYEALDEASSAKDSVQSYRKKVNRLKDRIEDLEEMEEQVEENDSELGYHSGSINGLRRLKADEEDVEEFQEKISSQMESMRENQKESVNNLGGEIEELYEETEELRDENERLRARVEETEKKLERGPAERFRRWAVEWYGIVSEWIGRWARKAYRVLVESTTSHGG